LLDNYLLPAIRSCFASCKPWGKSSRITSLIIRCPMNENFPPDSKREIFPLQASLEQYGTNLMIHK
jgi:hypothetical protein